MANEIINVIVNAVAHVEQFKQATRQTEEFEFSLRKLTKSTEDYKKALDALDTKSRSDQDELLAQGASDATRRIQSLNAQLVILKDRKVQIQDTGDLLDKKELLDVDNQIKNINKSLRDLSKERTKNTKLLSDELSTLKGLEDVLNKGGARKFALDIKHLGRELDQTSLSAETMAKKIDLATERLVKKGAPEQLILRLRNISHELRQASLRGEEFSHTGEQLLGDFEDLDGALDRLARHLSRFSPELGRTLQDATKHFQFGSEAAGGFKAQLVLLEAEARRLDLTDMADEIKRVHDQVDGINPSLSRFENSIKKMFPTFRGFKRELTGTSTDLDAFKRKIRDASKLDENFARAVAIMTQRTVIFLSSLTALLPFIGEFVAAIGNGVSGIFSMVAALSQLGGVLATLPGLFAAAAGAAAGLFAGIQPQSIIGAFTQLQTAHNQLAANKQFGTGGSGASGGSSTDPVLQERKLHLERMQNRLQELEAERALQDARRQAMEQLQKAEENLVRIRKQNAIDEQELKSDVTNAKARLAGLKAEGAAPEAIAAAEADLRIAQKNLKKFRVDAATEEKQAERDLSDARLQGIRDVQAAEINLQQVRISNQLQALSNEQAIAAARLKGADAGISGIRAYQLALANLDPVQRALVLKLFALRQEFQRLTKSTRDAILTRFLDWLKDNESLLPRIAKLVNGFALAVADVVGQFGKLIDTKAEQDRVFGIFEAGIPIVRRLGHAAALVADAIIGIADAAKPLTTFVTKGLEKFADAMDKAVKSSAKPPTTTDRGRSVPRGAASQAGSGFSSFFAGTEDTLKHVVNILGNLGKVLKNLFEAATPAGNTLLDIFEKFTAHLADVTSAKKGDIGAFFARQVPVFKELARVVGRALEAVANITDALTNPKSGKGGKSSLEIFLIRLRTQFIPFVEKLLIRFTKDLGPAVFDFLQSFGKAFEAITRNDGPLTLFLKIVSRVLDFIALVGNSKIGGFIIQFVLFNKLIGLGLRTLGLLGTAFVTLIRRIGFISQLLGKLFEPLFKVLGKVLPALVRFGGAIISFVGRFALLLGRAALPLLTNPIFLIVAALALAAYLIWKNWDTIGPLLQRAIDFIVHIFSEFGDFLGDVVGWIKDFVGNAIDFLKEHWQTIVKIFLGPLGLIIELFQRFGPRIAAAAGRLLEGALEKLQAAWGKIVDFFTKTVPGFFGDIKGGFVELWDDIKKGVDEGWHKITDLLGKWWDKIKKFFTDTIPSAFGEIGDVFGGLWDKIKAGVDSGWTSIVDTLRGWVASFARIIDDVADFLHLGRPLSFLEQAGSRSATQHRRSAGFAQGGVPSAGATGDGIVSPVPGGVYRVAEAGKPEAIMSLDPRYKERTLKIMDFVLQRLFGTSLLTLLKGPGFAAGGIPSFAGGGVGGNDGKRGDPTKNLVNLGSDIAGLYSALRGLDIPTLGGPFGEIAMSGLSWMKDHGLDWTLDKVRAGGKHVLSGFWHILTAHANGGIVGVPNFAEGGVTDGVIRTSSFNADRFRSNLMGYTVGAVPSFASGGIVTSAGGAQSSRVVRDDRPNVNIEVHTATEKADIDYIMRVAERRMQRF